MAKELKYLLFTNITNFNKNQCGNLASMIFCNGLFYLDIAVDMKKYNDKALTGGPQCNIGGPYMSLKVRAKTQLAITRKITFLLRTAVIFSNTVST